MAFNANIGVAKCDRCGEVYRLEQRPMFFNCDHFWCLRCNEVVFEWQGYHVWVAVDAPKSVPLPASDNLKRTTT